MEDKRSLRAFTQIVRLLLPPPHPERLAKEMDATTLWSLIDEHRGVAELREYLAEGGDVTYSHPDFYGWGFLHLACEMGNLEIIEALIAAGLSPDLVHPRGCAAVFTALDADIDGAIQTNSPINFRVTQFVLQKGARHDLLDERGRTLREAASAYGTQPLADFDRLLGGLISKSKSNG